MANGADRQQRTRECAYKIWPDEDRRFGRDKAQWEQAK
jgi:hypothetical protein